MKVSPPKQPPFLLAGALALATAILVTHDGGLGSRFEATNISLGTLRSVSTQIDTERMFEHAPNRQKAPTDSRASIDRLPAFTRIEP